MPKEKIDKVGFAERLLLKTEELGLSPADLAKDLGIKRQTVDHWFQGRSVPRAKRMVSLADRLDVSVSWLKRGVSILRDLKPVSIEQLKELAAMAPKDSDSSQSLTKEPEGSPGTPELTISKKDMLRVAEKEKCRFKDQSLALVVIKELAIIEGEDPVGYEFLINQIRTKAAEVRYKKTGKTPEAR